MFGVLVLLLVVGKEALAGRRCVSILAREDHLDSKLKQVLLDLRGAMVGCVVKQPVGIIAPVLVLLREHIGEARHEHEHDVTVRVELGQTQVKPPVRVDGRDHVDSVAQHFGRDGVVLARYAPFHVAEVQVRQPRLIDVYDTLALLEQCEHLLGVEHPRDKAPLRVALVGDLPELAVSHTQVVIQDTPHCVKSYS